MLIGVVSDTHRHTWIIEKVMEKLQNIDMLIHLGDNIQDVKDFKRYYNGEVISVKGNCDYSTSVPADIVVDIAGHKFLITHGHYYDVKHSLTRLKFKALELGVEVVLFGHTHISQIIYEEGIWFVNPGSPVIARDGFNSVAVIELEDNKINASIRAIK